MTYRSDYDALAAQNAALERKLREAQEERDLAIKERDEALQPPEPESLPEPLDLPNLSSSEPGKAPPPKPAPVAQWMIIGSMVAIGGGYFVYSMFFAMNRSVSPKWEATVRSAENSSIADGERCDLSADFSSNGGGRLHADHMRLTCGGQVLLDEEPSGQWEVWEGPGATRGTFKYRLKSVHDAALPARPLLNIDTQTKSATFLGEGGSKIVFTMEEYSAQLAGVPLFEGNDPSEAGFDLTYWQGKLASDSGGLPVGTLCEAKIMPRDSKSQNCRIEVSCGGINLYGAGDVGYNPCRVEGGVPVYANDDSTVGDPILLLDLKQGTIKISGDREVLITGEKVLP